jgi:hypothetical protein
MIEIFRTNITRQKDAERILNKIHSAFPGFEANFDLEDCDHILRIKSRETLICQSTINMLIETLGFFSEVLPDDLPNHYYGDAREKAFVSHPRTDPYSP